MPVETHPIHQHGVRSASDLYGCHNRAPLTEGFYVVDRTGVSYDSAGNAFPKYKLVFIPHAMSCDCKHDRRATDPRCAGCCWI